MTAFDPSAVLFHEGEAQFLEANGQIIDGRLHIDLTDDDGAPHARLELRADFLDALLAQRVRDAA